MLYRNQGIAHIEGDFLINRQTIKQNLKYYNRVEIKGLLENNYVAYVGKLREEEISMLKEDLRENFFTRLRKFVCMF